MCKVKCSTTNMTQLISRLNFLKSLQLKNVDLVLNNGQHCKMKFTMECNDAGDPVGHGSCTTSAHSKMLAQLKLSSSIIADDLFQSLPISYRTGDRYKDIALEDVTISTTTLVQLLDPDHLISLQLDNIAITQGDVASVDTARNRIGHMKLFTDDNELTAHSMPNTNPNQHAYKQTKFKLELRDCYVSTAVFQTLCSHIITPQIQVLDVSKAKLKENHIKILSKFLPKAFNLQKLDLLSNSMIMLEEHFAQQQQCRDSLSQLELGLYHACNTDPTLDELASSRFLDYLSHLHPYEVSLYGGGRKNHIGNDGLHVVLKNIHHLTKLKTFKISPIIDNRCSDLVKDCLAAIGTRIPEQAKMTYISIVNDETKIQSIKAVAAKHL